MAAGRKTIAWQWEPWLDAPLFLFIYLFECSVPAPSRCWRQGKKKEKRRGSARLRRQEDFLPAAADHSDADLGRFSLCMCERRQEGVANEKKSCSKWLKAGERVRFGFFFVFFLATLSYKLNENLKNLLLKLLAHVFWVALVFKMQCYTNAHQGPLSVNPTKWCNSCCKGSQKPPGDVTVQAWVLILIINLQMTLAIRFVLDLNISKNNLYLKSLPIIQVG